MENKKGFANKGVKNRKRGRDAGDIVKNAVIGSCVKSMERSKTQAKHVAPRHLVIPIKYVTKSELRIFLGLFLFRLLNSLLVQTYFVPDEYWQSIEVAHKAVFGYGFLTWEWREGMRSYVYPCFFSCYFYVLKFLQLDNRFLVIKGPMLLQSFLAALADLYMYKTALKLNFNHRVARWTLVCQLTSWYLFYASTRTLSNSAEASLVSIALYFLPWSKKDNWDIFVFIIISCISITLRPTALIIWVPLVVWQLKDVLDKKAFCRTITSWVVIGSFVFIMSIAIDFMFYGKYVNVYYNFFKFNVLSGMSSIYGTHPWHWYFSQGFISVLSSHVVLLALSVIRKHNPLFLFTILWTIIIYSFLPHKEFRFISGVLPFSIHLCGMSLHNMFETRFESASISTCKTFPMAPDHKNKTTDAKHQNKNKRYTAKILVIVALVCLNLPPALYTCLIHQRGTIDVMSYLANQAETNDKTNILFLMPCHSTPYYSYIHKNITMRFLTCEPNLSSQDNYTDEADEFFSEPSYWIHKQNWMTKDPENSEIPTHVVLFESLYNSLSTDLVQYGLRNNCAKFFHTHFPTGRIDSHLVVVCR